MALDQRRADKVTKLSGGTMRRLVLARSLVNDPDLLILDLLILNLLILDEPTTGLDSSTSPWQPCTPSSD